jgi:hypothetical protein
MSAVLVITTHGAIQVCENEHGTHDAELFTVPRDMTIVALNSVTPNIPNILPAKNVAPFVKIVRDRTSSKRFNASSSKAAMVEIVEEIKAEILENDDQIDWIAGQVKAKNENITGDGEIMAYFHHPDRLYQITTHGPGQTIYNKEFLRELGLVKGKSSNWKLNLLSSGVTRDEDLMDTLNPNVGKLRKGAPRTEDTVTRTESVIEELYARGIRKLIIIDLSCNVIRRGNYGVSATAERHVAFTHSRKGGKKVRKTMRTKRMKRKTHRK